MGVNLAIQNKAKKHPFLVGCLDTIHNTYQILEEAFTLGNKLLVCGNGGSASDAEHITAELMNRFSRPRKLSDNAKTILANSPYNSDHLSLKLQPAFPVISLNSQTSLMSAIANDIGYEMVFAQQVYGYGKKGDVLLGITTSGNSENILLAMSTAKALGMKCISLTGVNHSKILSLSDNAIQVPATMTADIQEQHIVVYHLLCELLEQKFL